MSQAELFYDTIYDAIHNAILSCDGFKVVAGKLWPAMKPSSAYARLKSCVDEHKDEKLCMEEVLVIAKLAKERGNHALMQYLGDELGYSIQALEPEDERAAIQREFVNAVERLEQIQQRMARTEQRVRAVR
jgi:hypothetical protein